MAKRTKKKRKPAKASPQPKVLETSKTVKEPQPERTMLPELFQPLYQPSKEPAPRRYVRWRVR